MKNKEKVSLSRQKKSLIMILSISVFMQLVFVGPPVKEIGVQRAMAQSSVDTDPTPPDESKPPTPVPTPFEPFPLPDDCPFPDDRDCDQDSDKGIGWVEYFTSFFWS